MKDFLEVKMVEKHGKMDYGKNVKLKNVRMMKKITTVMEDGISVINIVKENL